MRSVKFLKAEIERLLQRHRRARRRLNKVKFKLRLEGADFADNHALIGVSFSKMEDVRAYWSALWAVMNTKDDLRLKVEEHHRARVHAAEKKLRKGA